MAGEQRGSVHGAEQTSLSGRGSCHMDTNLSEPRLFVSDRGLIVSVQLRVTQVTLAGDATVPHYGFTQASTLGVAFYDGERNDFIIYDPLRPNVSLPNRLNGERGGKKGRDAAES